MDLRGRNVIVTGATGGIGEPLCQALVAAGANVLAVARDRGRLDRLVRGAPAGRIEPVVADLATTAGRQAVLAAAQQAHVPPSVLVLGHAQSAFGLFEDQDPDAIARLVQVNLTASLLLVHALQPMLRAHGDAAVVVVGSTFGSLAYPGFAAYSASKFGLRGMTEALAREYADGPVHFQYLSPRATRTPFNSPAVDALNAELDVAVDAPDAVARQLVRAIVRGQARLQLGWPEKLFARLNGLLPGLVDRALRPQLPAIRRHARSPNPQENPAHEALPS